jgi:hypothetical protein
VRLRLQPHPVGVQIVMHDGQCPSAAAAAAAATSANAPTKRTPAGERGVLRLVLAEGLKHAFALRPWQVS